MAAKLEHVNVTVSDLERSVALVQDLFGWQVRWRGGAIHGGESAHMGDTDTYVALYQHAHQSGVKQDNYTTTGGLNHIGVLVEDLDAVEAKVKAAGLTPYNHADYEPGRRFYFDDHDGTEWEVVSYA
ncbi:VOC family protein [Aquicoccus sp. G2-2]|uniref:VOC family protein n=1 Tax=Aquicoccus sp. G2-2 TaxID=3092120 RepID=UPI002ADFE2C3|nr:VOC family protein [Aquicoccus sp. G2-2]MEA1112460.1 VOC family protein [Aquicoccus sp. G2-2]